MTKAAPPLVYAALALAFWGPWVLGDPGSKILAANDVDPSAYLWFFSWWPHALLHGLNPFFTHVIFVPDGYNLAWVTSMPGPSVVLAPITLTLGPEITWNLLLFGAPVLSAWTAYLLCRHVTGAALPSLVGGYLFGFSPYMFSQLRGAPQLAFVALLPLMALLVVRHAEGTLSDRRFGIALTAVLTAQILISTEVLATAVVLGAAVVVAAYLLYPERRAALGRTTAISALALAATAVLASPLLAYVLFGERTLPEQALDQFPGDLLSFVVPGALVAGSPERWGGDVPSWATGAAYLGVPLIALVGAFAWTRRRERAARLAVIAFAIAVVATLGTALHVGGHDSGVPLPWRVIAELPLLRYAIPLRLSVFVFLAAAVVLAMWLARRPTAWHWGLAAVALAFLAPAVGNEQWHTKLNELAFFEDGAYKDHLEPGDHVLTLPTGGRNMRWQVQADFSFDLAAGYVGAVPESYTRYPAWDELSVAPFPPRENVPAAELRRFIDAKGVTAIVAEDPLPAEWRAIIGEVASQPERVDGALFYRLAPPPAG